MQKQAPSYYAVRYVKQKRYSSELSSEDITHKDIEAIDISHHEKLIQVGVVVSSPVPHYQEKDRISFSHTLSMLRSA